MRELDAARVVLAAVRAEMTAGERLTGSIWQAMKQHDSLVDDTEAPSAWTGIGANTAIPGKF